VTVTIELTGGYTPSNPISDADLKKICTNLLTEVPGGVCEVVESFLSQTVGRRRRSLQEISFFTMVTLTAQYSSNSSVVEIFNEITNSNFTDSLISGVSGNVESTTAVGLIFALAPQIPVVSTDSVSDTTWTGSFTDTKADSHILACSTKIYFGEWTNSPSGFTGTVENLSPVTTYYCSVVAVTYSVLEGQSAILLVSNFVQIKTDPSAGPPP
jgi:hypothetical protein